MSQAALAGAGGSAEPAPRASGTGRGRREGGWRGGRRRNRSATPACPARARQRLTRPGPGKEGGRGGGGAGAGGGWVARRPGEALPRAPSLGTQLGLAGGPQRGGLAAALRRRLRSASPAGPEPGGGLQRQSRAGAPRVRPPAYPGGRAGESLTWVRPSAERTVGAQCGRTGRGGGSGCRSWGNAGHARGLKFRDRSLSCSPRQIHDKHISRTVCVYIYLK